MEFEVSEAEADEEYRVESGRVRQKPKGGHTNTIFAIHGNTTFSCLSQASSAASAVCTPRLPLIA